MKKIDYFDFGYDAHSSGNSQWKEQCESASRQGCRCSGGDSPRWPT